MRDMSLEAEEIGWEAVMEDDPQKMFDVLWKSKVPNPIPRTPTN